MFLTGCNVTSICGILHLIHERTTTVLAYGIFKDIQQELTADKLTQVMFIYIGATALQVAMISFKLGKVIIKLY